MIIDYIIATPLFVLSIIYLVKSLKSKEYFIASYWTFIALLSVNFAVKLVPVSIYLYLVIVVYLVSFYIGKKLGEGNND